MSRPRLNDERHDLAREARAATGLTQADFARLLDVASSTVYFWEKGQVNPSRFSQRVLRAIVLDPEGATRLLRAAGALAHDVASVALPSTPRRRRRRLPRRRVLAALRGLPGGSTGNVPLDVLRGQLADLDSDEVDETLLALEQAGRLTLEPAMFPALLSDAERASAIHDPERGLLLFAAVRAGRGMRRRNRATPGQAPGGADGGGEFVDC